MEYMARCLDGRLDRLLSVMGAVLVEGPRACGKTSTGLHHAHSSVRLDAPGMADLAVLDPAGILEGDAPRLIDEWQLAPELWNAIRHQIDARQRPGQFILSGSARPTDDVRRHSGAGRFARMRMRPMTLAEAGLSTKLVSLHDLAQTARTSGIRSDLTYRDLGACAVRGGWPGLLGHDEGAAREFMASYVEDILDVDIVQAVGIHHEPTRLRRLLASMARNIATEAGPARLATDMSTDGATIDLKTIRNYLDALIRIFVLEEQPAWSASLRSRARLRQQPKIHFSDPSIACGVLRLSSERLSRDPSYFGQVFESMAVRDIRSYAEAHGGTIFHYRDSNDLEVDMIVEFSDGTWAALEVKLGPMHIPKAEASLLKLRDERVDLSIAGEPAFLAVITGTEHGYTLPSGVHVVPLGALTW